MPRRATASLVSVALGAPLLLLGSTAQAAPTVAPSVAPVSKVAKPYDFRGDGYPDLVTGAPGLRVGTHAAAGGVTIVEATKAGLATTSPRLLTQASEGVPGPPKTGGVFGTAFASADIDHDGYADLAVGQPSDGLDHDDAGGTVTILFGSAAGLTTDRAYVVKRAAQPAYDRFGEAVVLADLTGDGYAELAVGAGAAEPVEGPEYYPNGVVTVFTGGFDAFTSGNSTNLYGQRSGNDYDLLFGSSLAVGNVDGDSRLDLVVGAYGKPYDDGEGHAGSVSVCPSGAAGPGECRHVGVGQITGSTALAVGNVTGDKRNEIVVGQPYADSESDLPGEVFTLVLSGSGSSLKTTVKRLDQGSKGVPGSKEIDDKFGSSIALGDLDRDGYADLVVGSSGEGIGKAKAAGRVTVVYGGKKGYRTSGNKAYDQNTKGIPGSAETDDRFGAAVSLLDHDGDKHLDLAIGAPGENATGAVTTLRGSGKSFTTKRADTFGLDRTGYADRQDAEFGSALPR